MSETQEMSFSEVASHNSKKDLYVVIHEKVYDATQFVDEHPYVSPLLYIASRELCAAPSLPPHIGAEEEEAQEKHTRLLTRARPKHTCLFNLQKANASSLRMNRGGEEVLLDVGGQDATEAFEDVGHSDEARTILDGLIKGNLKRI
ncbi:MAG: hypothetical protein Q9174_003745, partial [Haloplaca sp. 1 TL-2023]